MAAPRRELDPNRIAKLPPLASIATPETYPKSHVQVGSGPSPLFYGKKFDSNFRTDEEREKRYTTEANDIEKSIAYKRTKGINPDVIKIDSSK